MKTQELIERLQAADPSGQEHCCIENADIWHVSDEPAFYDGALHIIERDADNRPIKGYRRRQGRKINLSPIRIADALEYETFVVSYLTEDDRQRYEKTDLEARRADKEIDFQVEMDTFSNWVFLKIQAIKPIPLGWVTRIQEASEAFYKRHRGPDVDGQAIKERSWGWEKGSWAGRLEDLWEELISVDWDDYSRIGIEFRKAP